ncbi:MAG TPA: TCR/Tet family MFS transporter [Pseudomonadales bacterium]|nr:TCR/Tet family MFS transporter [Pseudomonadales bacterium]
MARTPGRHALAFIMVTLVIDTLGFGIIIPVLPGLIAELTGGTIAAAAGYGGALMFVFALMQFCCAPILGGLSDRFGRRPVLLLALATLTLDYLIMGFADSVVLLFVGRILSGASAATFSTANAYIADITPEAERAGRFGLVGAAFGIGFIFGPALGGLLGEFDLRLPFFVAAGLAFTNLLYGLLVLPETLPPGRRRPFEWRRANPVAAIRLLRNTAMGGSIAVALVLHFVAHDVNPATWTYYALHKFDWSQGQVGAALAVVGLSSAIVSGTLVGPIVARLGEVRAAYLGLLSAALAFFGYAFASEGWMMFPWVFVGAFIGLVMPSLRGLLSRSTPAEAQGELQGAIGSLVGLTSIVGPLLMTQTFRYFSTDASPYYFPGAAFFLAACLALAAAAAVATAVRRLPAAGAASA